MGTGSTLLDSLPNQNAAHLHPALMLFSADMCALHPALLSEYAHLGLNQLLPVEHHDPQNFADPYRSGTCGLSKFSEDQNV
jgi:hypothetical protein